MEKGRLGMTRTRHVTTMFNSLTSHTRPLPGRSRNVFSKKAEIEAIIRRYQPEIDDHGVHAILSIFAEIENGGDGLYLPQEIASILEGYGSFATSLPTAAGPVLRITQEIREVTEHKEELDSKPLETPVSPHVDSVDDQIRYDNWFPPLSNSTSTVIGEAHQSRAACWGDSPRLKQILQSRSASLKRKHNGVQKRLSHSTSPHYLKKAQEKSVIGEVSASKASESGFICRGPDPSLKAEIRRSAISAFKQLRRQTSAPCVDLSDAVRPAKLARGIGTSSDVVDQLLNMQLGSGLDEATASKANWSFGSSSRERKFLPIRAAPDPQEEIVTEAPPPALTSPFVSEPLECCTIGYLSYVQVSGKVQECSVLTPTLDHVFPDGCVHDSCMLDPNDIEESVSIEELMRGGRFDGSGLCTNNVIKFVYKSKRNTKRIQTSEDSVFECEEVEVEESEESETEEREEGEQFYLGSELLESLEQGEFVRDEGGASCWNDDEMDNEEWPAPPPPEALPQLAALDIWGSKDESCSSFSNVFGNMGDDARMETACVRSPQGRSMADIACLWPGASAQSCDSGVASWREDDLSKVWQHEKPRESGNECVLRVHLSDRQLAPHGETRSQWCNNVEEALARTMNKVCTPDKLKTEKQLLGPSLFDAVFSSDSECDRVMPGLGPASCGEGSFDATRKLSRNIWAMSEDPCKEVGAIGEPVGAETSGGNEAAGLGNNSVIHRPMARRPLEHRAEFSWRMADATGEQSEVAAPGDAAKLDWELASDMDNVLTGMFWLQADSYSAPIGASSSSEEVSDTESWKRRNGILGLEDYSDEDTGPFVSRRLRNPNSPALAGSGDKRSWSLSEGHCVSSPNKRLKSYRDPLTQEDMDDDKVFHSFFKRHSEAASSLPELPVGGARSRDLEERWRHEADGSYRVQQPMLGATKAPGVQPKVCSLYLEGLCERSVCRYSHDPALITCRHWEQNKCYKGSACPFLHGYRPRGCFEGLSCEQLGYSWKDTSPGKSGGEGAVSRASPSTRSVRRRLNFGSRSRNPSGSESKPHDEKRRTRRKSGSTSSTSGTHRTRSRGGKPSSPVDIVNAQPPWRRRTRSGAAPDDEWGL